METQMTEQKTYPVTDSLQAALYLFANMDVKKKDVKNGTITYMFDYDEVMAFQDLIREKEYIAIRMYIDLFKVIRAEAISVRQAHKKTMNGELKP